MSVSDIEVIYVTVKLDDSQIKESGVIMINEKIIVHHENLSDSINKSDRIIKDSFSIYLKL